VANGSLYYKNCPLHLFQQSCIATKKSHHKLIVWQSKQVWSSLAMALPGTIRQSPDMKRRIWVILNQSIPPQQKRWQQSLIASALPRVLQNSSWLRNWSNMLPLETQGAWKYTIQKAKPMILLHPNNARSPIHNDREIGCTCMKHSKSYCSPSHPFCATWSGRSPSSFSHDRCQPIMQYSKGFDQSIHEYAGKF